VEHGGISSYLVIRKPVTPGVDEFQREREFVGSEVPPEGTNVAYGSDPFRHALAILE